MQLRRSSTPESIISSHLIPMFLEPETLCLMNSVWMLRHMRRSVHGGLSAFQLYCLTTTASKWCSSQSSLNGHVQVLLRLCSSTICCQIDSRYIYRETLIMHTILRCSESCEWNKDEYDKTKCLVVMWDPLLCEYSNKASAELHSGLSFCRSLPQIWAEISGGPRFDYSISQIS